MATISERRTEDGERRYQVKVRLKGYPPQAATFRCHHASADDADLPALHAHRSWTRQAHRHQRESTLRCGLAFRVAPVVGGINAGR